MTSHLSERMRPNMSGSRAFDGTFFFKEANTVRVFPEDQIPDERPRKLIAASSRYGVVFVATPEGIICFERSTAMKLSRWDDIHPRRELFLGLFPSHIDVSLDGESLAVVTDLEDVPYLSIYEVKSFGQNTTKMNEIRLSTSQGTYVVDLQWKPGVPDMVGAVLSDGSLITWSATAFRPLTALPASLGGTCFSWSPEGDRLVLGTVNGDLLKFKCHPWEKLKTIRAPFPKTSQTKAISVKWLSSNEFLVMYDEGETAPVFVILHGKRTGLCSHTPYKSELSWTGYQQPQYFFTQIPDWDVIIVGCVNSMDTFVLKKENDDFEVLNLDETNSAELSTSTSTHDDVCNLGMALDYSSQDRIQLGKEWADPMPLLFMVSSAGVVSIFHAINCEPGAKKLCAPSGSLDTVAKCSFASVRADIAFIAKGFEELEESSIAKGFEELEESSIAKGFEESSIVKGFEELSSIAKGFKELEESSIKDDSMDEFPQTEIGGPERLPTESLNYIATVLKDIQTKQLALDVKCNEIQTSFKEHFMEMKTMMDRINQSLACLNSFVAKNYAVLRQGTISQPQFATFHSGPFGNSGGQATNQTTYNFCQ